MEEGRSSSLTWYRIMRLIDIQKHLRMTVLRNHLCKNSNHTCDVSLNFKYCYDELGTLVYCMDDVFMCITNYDDSSMRARISDFT